VTTRDSGVYSYDPDYQQWHEDLFGPLVGRKIEAVWVDCEEQKYLHFATDQGPIYYGTSGSCCSETWFADIFGVEALLEGGPILKVEVAPDKTKVRDGRSRQQVDEIYGFTLTTSHGRCDIAFRNSSNGWYDGSIVLSPNLPAHRVPWQRITGDWSA